MKMTGLRVGDHNAGWLPLRSVDTMSLVYELHGSAPSTTGNTMRRRHNAECSANFYGQTKRLSCSLWRRQCTAPKTLARLSDLYEHGWITGSQGNVLCKIKIHEGDEIFPSETHIRTHYLKGGTGAAEWNRISRISLMDPNAKTETRLPTNCSRKTGSFPPNHKDKCKINECCLSCNISKLSNIWGKQRTFIPFRHHQTDLNVKRERDAIHMYYEKTFCIFHHAYRRWMKTWKDLVQPIGALKPSKQGLRF